MKSAAMSGRRLTIGLIILLTTEVAQKRLYSAAGIGLAAVCYWCLTAAPGQHGVEAAGFPLATCSTILRCGTSDTSWTLER